MTSTIAPRTVSEHQLRDHIDPQFLDTPYYPTATLSRLLGLDLRLKVESVNEIGCFKGRGASLLVSEHVARRGAGTPLVTASAGNWGQAIAHAALGLGPRVTVFAPTGANDRKVARMRDLGAEVMLGGADVDEAKDLARRFACDRGHRFIEDGADRIVSDGHGTIAREIVDCHARERTRLDAILVPVGNGALALGIAEYLRRASPTTEVVGVVPEQAPSMRDAWRTPGDPTSWQASPPSTMADGLAIREPIIEMAHRLQVIDDVVTVSESDLARSVGALHREAGLVTEPSGAASVAAALADPARFSGRTVAAIITGSNLAPGDRHLLEA